MTELIAGASIGALARGVGQFTRPEKAVLTIGSLVAMSLFTEAGRIFHLPTYPEFSASLLQQIHPVGSIVVTLIVFLVSVVLCSIIAGGVRFDAGIFCASIGLFILGLRGGPTRYAVFEANSPKVLITFFVETILLGGILVAGYFLQRLLLQNRLLRKDDAIDVEADAPNSVGQHALGLACNVIVIFVMVLLLAQSDRKAQVGCALAVACSIGACAGYYVAPAPQAVWCWAGPLVAGALGYLLNYFAGASGWQIGQFYGTFAPLARPMPLDYAGIGVAASLLGFWASRTWSHEHEQEPVPENAT